MIAYLDSSAIMPLLVPEPTTGRCTRTWAHAERRVTARVAHVEVAAALAMAERLGRLDGASHDIALERLEMLLTHLAIVELTPRLTESAADCARRYALRGYDAVHCAAALAVADADVVAVAGDGPLLDSWRSAGLAVLDTNRGRT